MHCIAVKKGLTLWILNRGKYDLSELSYTDRGRQGQFRGRGHICRGKARTTKSINGDAISNWALELGFAVGHFFSYIFTSQLSE